MQTCLKVSEAHDMYLYVMSVVVVTGIEVAE